MTCVTLQDITLSGIEQLQNGVWQGVCEVGADSSQTQRRRTVAMWLRGGDRASVYNGTKRCFFAN